MVTEVIERSFGDVTRWGMGEQLLEAERNEFQVRFFSGLISDHYEYHVTRTDDLRFGGSPPPGLSQRVKNEIARILSKSGFGRRYFSIDAAADNLAFISNHIAAFEKSYQLLSDDYSRDLFVELLRFKVLGPKHVRLSSNNDEYWARYDAVDRRHLKETGTLQTPFGWYLNRYQVEGRQGAVHLHGTATGILNTFVLEQYAYRRGAGPVQVDPGDVVLDGGGCWGDSGLYFADRAGAQGQTYCFEFVPDNLRILQHNVDMNRHLKSTIRVVPNALSRVSGEVVSYAPDGPGTSLEGVGALNGCKPAALETTTVAIDDFVQANGVGRVDFIKMDIEGSELKALQGAEQSLRAFRPKLAICLYHKQDDFIAIPGYLHQLGLGYEFYLDHFTTHDEETVLFAKPPER